MSTFTRYDASMSVQYHQQASNILQKDYWVVTEPFVYRVGSLDSNKYVSVHSGFLTDGASVPRAFWSLLPPWGDYGQAAVLHDFLCEYGEVNIAKYDDNKQPVGYHKLYIDRQTTDKIFYEAMEVLEVPTAKRLVMYKAVELYRKFNKIKKAGVDPLKHKLTLEISYNLSSKGTTELSNEQVSQLILLRGDKR